MKKKKYFKKFRQYSLVRKIFNILGIILLALVCLEIFLRLLGLLFEIKFSSGKVNGNSGSADFTIVCVGDSWTAGNPRENYPKFLRRRLSDIFPKKKFVVVNLGVSGSNSTMALKKISEKIDKYSPDLVIVMTGNNDHWNLSFSSYWLFETEKLTGFDLLMARLKVSLHRLRTYRFFTMLYKKIAGLPAANEFFYRELVDDKSLNYPVSLDRETFEKQLKFNLVKMVEMSREKNYNLIFMTYFHFHGYKVNEIIRETAITFDVNLVDNNFYFHKQIPHEKYRDYLIPDGHPNGKGYDFIAGKIVGLLNKREIVK